MNDSNFITMFEIVKQYKNNSFTHCTVEKIQVYRISALPGEFCLTFSGIDHDGIAIRGKYSQIYHDVCVALGDMKRVLAEEMESKSKVLERLKNESKRSTIERLTKEIADIATFHKNIQFVSLHYH